MKIKKHLDLLGYKVVDKVSGFSGIVDSVCFDLYGCIQASVKPEMDKEGKLPEGWWIDVSRVTVKSKKPVMEVPNFDYGIQAEGKQGPANKKCRFDKRV